MQLEVVWNLLLQAGPGGLPSSSVQLRTLYVKSALVAHLEIPHVLELQRSLCFIAEITDPS